jgi:hypothetical protein
VKPVPSRAPQAGRAYLDLRSKARRDRRPVDVLMQLYVLESFLARLAGATTAVIRDEDSYSGVR